MKKLKTQLKVGIKAVTNGRGFWCYQEPKPMEVHSLEINYVQVYDGQFNGELRAYFTKKSWNTATKGLAYTDPEWLRGFKKGLKKVGFSDKVIKNLSYTEQGMQGNDYVSLYADHQLIVEWLNKGLFFVGNID